MTGAPNPDSLGPGSLVGSWRVEGYVGRGTYGVVYRARRDGEPGSTPVALKLALFPYDPRFVREVELLSRLHHPAVPRLVDKGVWLAGADAVHPYLVTEWMRGLPLYEWARGHRPTSRQVLRVLAQVAWALDAMHRGDCLHRDVKGDNILVDLKGRALLLDFGSGTWAGAPSITESILPPGTREYRSPEALRFQWEQFRQRGARYEARPTDDLYALGVSAYRVVTRVYPPPGTDPEELKNWLRAPSPLRAPPQALNGRVAPELAALIERMLAKEPEARGLAREVAEAAESAAEHAGPEADVPLSDPAGPVVEAVAVPAQVVPWAGAERFPSESMVVPLRDVSRSGAEHSACEAEVVPARSWGWRPAMVAAAGILLLVGAAWCVAHWPRVEKSDLAQAEAPDAVEASDAGTAGLGDGMLAARGGAEAEPLSSGAIGVEMPEEPLPGQRRAPCRRRGEVEINGGCWGLAKAEPPCGEVAYEWQGACYHPMIDRIRKPTSEKPR